MQQDTPQSSQPASAPPQAPPSPPAAPPSVQGGQFYQPAQPTAYHSSAAGHAPYDTPAAKAAPAPSVSWEASEYVHINKGGLWLLGFGIIVAAFAGLSIYLQAWTFLALIIVMAIAMAYFAFRPPHTLSYTVNDSGIQIGDKIFRYEDFRAFGVMQDGAFFTMSLIPIKRFSPAVSIYFAEEQGEHIVDIVGEHLPMENLEPDIIDRIMHRLRF